MKYEAIKQISNQDIFFRSFKHNGSKNLNIDGSVIPIEFNLLSDLTVEKVILNRIDFIISCGSAINLSNFASLAAPLTNGVYFVIDGNQIFKNNGDIMLFATDAGTETGKVQSVDTSFINGHWDLLKTYNNGVVCNVADLKIIIRDNLSAINYFQVTASGIKIS